MGIEVGDPSKQAGVSSEFDVLDDESDGTRYKIEYEFISDIASRSNKYAENVKNAYASGKDKLKAAPGFDKVRVAGEPERESRAKREREGVPVDAATWAEIEKAAAKVKLDPARVRGLAQG